MSSKKETEKIVSSLNDALIDLKLNLEKLKKLDETEYNQWIEFLRKNDIAVMPAQAQQLQYLPMTFLELTGLSTLVDRLANQEIDAISLGVLTLIYKDHPMKIYTNLNEMTDDTDDDIDDIDDNDNED